MIISTVSIDSHGTAIQTELFRPAASNGAAIIIVHGSDGMTEPWAAGIREYATDLAAKGFTGIIPNYFEKTRTPPGLNIFSQPPAECIANLHSWEEAVSDTVAHAKTLPGMSVPRIGLLGFSLGGHICLRLRGLAHALVELFAPELRDFGGLGPVGAASPHIQIHHGLADLLVPFSNAQAIFDALKDEGADPELYSYEGASHGFAGADPNNATARRSSKDRTLAFFEKHLAH
jgi:dienelactone hydrolase